jgi:hypothetical protein
VTDTVVSLRSVAAGGGVARAGLPYFTVWPQTLGERPQCGLGVHLYNCQPECRRGRSHVQLNLVNIHGPTAPPGSVYVDGPGLADSERVRNASFSLVRLFGKLPVTTEV